MLEGPEITAEWQKHSIKMHDALLFSLQMEGWVSAVNTISKGTVPGLTYGEIYLQDAFYGADDICATLVDGAISMLLDPSGEDPNVLKTVQLALGTAAIWSNDVLDVKFKDSFVTKIQSVLKIHEPENKELRAGFHKVLELLTYDGLLQFSKETMSHTNFGDPQRYVDAFSQDFLQN